MAVPAHWVAAALRDRLPDVTAPALRRLLCLCQAHHLAAFDEPMFAEPVVSTDRGPVVVISNAAPGTLGPGRLAIADHVAGRYGHLSEEDLGLLADGPAPGRTAAEHRGGAAGPGDQRTRPAAHRRASDSAPDDTLSQLLRLRRKLAGRGGGP